MEHLSNPGVTRLLMSNLATENRECHCWSQAPYNARFIKYRQLLKHKIASVDQLYRGRYRIAQGKTHEKASRNARSSPRLICTVLLPSRIPDQFVRLPAFIFFVDLVHSHAGLVA